MYRVVVTSRGKYNNAKLGARYCLTKRSVINLAVSFESFECEYEIEKFVRLHNDIFAWSEVVDRKIWEKINKALEEEEKEDAEV